MLSESRRTAAAIARAERAARKNPSADADALVVETRREHKTTKLASTIREEVNSWPPLTASQRDRLAQLLHGAA